MRIEVTESDIDDGVRHDCERCPIARALKRQTGESWHVDATEASLFRGIKLPDGSYRSRSPLVLDLPAEAACFIDQFDDGLPVEPFAFELEGL